MKFLAKRNARVVLALIVAVLLIAAITGSAAAAGPVYHTVLPGQTLFSIASSYGVSVWAISCANGLYNPNYIYAGMVLYIPSGWNGGGCKPANHPSYPDGNNCNCQPPRVLYPQPNPCCQQKPWGDNVGYRPQPNPCCQPPYQPEPCCQPQPQPPIYHPQPCCGGGPDCFYTVRWGDHLYRIALQFGTSWVNLAVANDLHNGNYIYAGQVLRIPGCN